MKKIYGIVFPNVSKDLLDTIVEMVEYHVGKPVLFDTPNKAMADLKASGYKGPYRMVTITAEEEDVQ